MSEPYMSHGWMHALVRPCDDQAPEATGTVVDVDESGHRVKVRWLDESATWEAKRDLVPVSRHEYDRKWINAVARLRDQPGQYGTVIDETPEQVKIDWPSGAMGWYRKRNIVVLD